MTGWTRTPGDEPKLRLRHLTTTALLLLGVAAAACAPRPTDRGAVLVVGAGLDGIRTFDPAAVAEPAADVIMRNACDQLLMPVFADPLRIGPGVAETWSASADGRTFTFRIAPGRRFPSGRNVTAHDAAWSIGRALRSGLAAAQWYGQWGLTAENVGDAVRALDAQTLQITLPKAYNRDLVGTAFGAYFATVLDREEVLRHAVDGDEGARWLKTHSACAGPYRLASWTPNSAVILERNPHHPGREGPDRIVFWHVAESASQRIMLQKGDIDVATAVSAADARAYGRDPSVRVVRAPSPTVYFLAFNQADPRFRDPRVVAAMKHLIDYQGVEQRILAGVGFARQSVLPLGAFGAAEADFRPYRHDPERARALLESAGAQDLTFDLATTGRFPAIEIAQQFQASAARAGMRVRLRQYTDKHLSTLHRSRRFEAVLNDFGFGAPDGFFVLNFFATNPDNRAEAGAAHLQSWRAGWAPPAELSRTVEALGAPSEEPDRLQKFRAAERTLAEVGPFAPVAQAYSLVASRTEVTGLKSTFIGPWYRQVRISEH